MFARIKSTLIEKPALVLLFFVFLFVIPRSVSYEQAWQLPELYYIKSGVLKTGPALNVEDIKNGLNWQVFEYLPRCTRPWSSYLEILDTKFRCWLWHFMLPHPSLSLIWFFTLVLSPILLYRILRNLSVGSNIAITMISFYLATPEVLSGSVMLFRPAKPMSNFFIILCLYVASQLKKRFLDQGASIPWQRYAGFWFLCALSFYWDETAYLIFPAVIFIFPRVIFHRKSYVCLWLLLPVFTYLGLFYLIPYLSKLAGQEMPKLENYMQFINSLNYKNPLALKKLNIIQYYFKFLGINSKNLVLESMGFIFPFSMKASIFIKTCIGLALLAWAVVLTYLLSAKKKLDRLLPLMIALVLFFNYLVAMVMQVWGPYYYGSFWSVFLVIYLGLFIERANIPKYVLTACFCVIILNLSNAFITTNIIYKKYHYYLYDAGEIRQHYEGRKLRFDPAIKPVFTGNEIKADIKVLWEQRRTGGDIRQFAVPKELAWLALELEPDKNHAKFEMMSNNGKQYIYERLSPDNKNYVLVDKI